MSCWEANYFFIFLILKKHIQGKTEVVLDASSDLRAYDISSTQIRLWKETVVQFCNYSSTSSPSETGVQTMKVHPVHVLIQS